MPVYMIRQGERGPVKIGVSRDVASRVAGLQTATHEPLTLLRAFEGGAAEERRLHELFADHRISGEWFSFTKAMLGDLGLVEIGEPEEDDAPWQPETDIEFLRWVWERANGPAWKALGMGDPMLFLEEKLAERARLAALALGPDPSIA